MQIGDIKLGVGAALAPMAGASDAAMREVCARFGAVFTVSEMVSAKALTMRDKKSRTLLVGGGGTAPYGVQLFGCEPKVMEEAVPLIDDMEFDFLDLNLGCPAPKVVQNGGGSALLRDPVLAEKWAAAAVKASRRPVTAKLRLGWNTGERQGVEVAKRLESAGICLLTVHARTREEMYHPGVHHEAVAEIKRAVGIPVLYNGDVQDVPSALQAMQNTGCDGLMVGRAAMGMPWIFGQIAAALQGVDPMPIPSLQERFALMDNQVQALCQRMGEPNGMRHARGVAAAYLKGLRGAAALRKQAHGLENYTDLARLMEAALERQQQPIGEEDAECEA